MSDHLLGIIELVNNVHETGHSETLCQAALEQVDHETKDRDFTGAVPHPKHLRWGMIAGVAAALAVVAMLVVPAAGGNALWRWAMPWKNTPRYTFAQLNELPSEMIVPVGERSALIATLSESTRWSPETGTVKMRGMDRIEAGINENSYDFVLPPLKEVSSVNLSIGDARHEIKVQPESRPELKQLLAEIQLPDYLQRPDRQSRDVRGGAISLVKGSLVQFNMVATRALAHASLNDADISVKGDTVSTPMLRTLANDDSTNVIGPDGIEFKWTDELGLTPGNPLHLKINVVEDEQPSLFCRNMSDKRVVMAKDTLTFEFSGEDDFGVKTVGMEWSGISSKENPEPVSGEKIVAAGNPEAADLEGVQRSLLGGRISSRR